MQKQKTYCVYEWSKIPPAKNSPQHFGSQTAALDERLRATQCLFLKDSNQVYKKL